MLPRLSNWMSVISNRMLVGCISLSLGIMLMCCQMLATSAKNILLLGYGMTLGFPTIVIPSLQPHFNNVTDLREKDILSLTEEQISWFSK